MKPAQRFLFLQGPRSPFFARLAAAVQRAGQQVRKIHFSAADALYWHLPQAMHYRAGMARLPAFYAEQFDQYGISDIVLFGDCRPLHRPAIALARQRGLRVHVFEEGYFRPYWITLEQGGVNGHSRLPKDPAWYRAQAHRVPHYGNGQAFAAPFWQRAAYDIACNLCAAADPLLYPGLQSHTPVHPWLEYLGYMRRGALLPWRARQAAKTAARLLRQAAQQPFYLFALQLDSDAQILHHAPFDNMAHAMRHVLASFARCAGAHTRLVVKIHPLDPGLVNHRQQLYAAARALGVAQRVFFLDAGHLPTLLSAAAAVVTVNSTVGTSALVHQRPTIALGQAIYALPGLVFQGPLDAFWRGGEKPDAALLRAFRNVVIHRTQINGGFYSRAGIQLAVENAVPRLLRATAQ